VRDKNGRKCARAAGAGVSGRVSAAAGPAGSP